MPFTRDATYAIPTEKIQLEKRFELNPRFTEVCLYLRRDISVSYENVIGLMLSITWYDSTEDKDYGLEIAFERPLAANKIANQSLTFHDLWDLEENGADPEDLPGMIPGIILSRMVTTCKIDKDYAKHPVNAILFEVEAQNDIKLTASAELETLPWLIDTH